MNRHDDSLLDSALEEIRNDVPDAEATRASTDRSWQRIADRLASDQPIAGAEVAVGTIEGCDDFQTLIPAFVAGELSATRTVLVEDHTRECLACRRALLAAREGRTIEAPKAFTATPQPIEKTSGWSRGWLAAAAIFVVTFGVALAWAGGLIGGVGSAQVASIDGNLFLVTDNGSMPIRAGDEISRGREVRTGKDSGAVVRLADGSLVEMRERSQFAVSGSRANTVIDLNQGSVIVEAAKRSRGHLFVDTDECRVAVTGTIFSVSHGLKGSRVSVIEGAVRVEQGRREELLAAGDQVTTRVSLASVPVSEDISWSQNLDRYLAVLAEMKVLRDELDRSLPEMLPRSDSRLLDLSPEGTRVYVAIPNLSETVVETKRVISERLDASPVLREWWQGRFGPVEVEEEIDELFARISEYGAYFGEEMVVTVGEFEPETTTEAPDALFLAEVTDEIGLRSLIEADLNNAEEEIPIVLVDSAAQAVALASGTEEEIFVWINQGLVAATPFADSLVTLESILASPAASGFVGSEFHSRLAAAYDAGVEWLVGVDVESLMSESLANESAEELAMLGFDSAEHLLVSWSQDLDQATGQAELTFSGPRTGIASWLAEPAPMGSLDFVSPNASVVTAFVMREPAALLDELLEFLGRVDPEALTELDELQQSQGFDLRRDLVSLFGGEMAIAADGPILPQPAVAAVIEVFDPIRLQITLEMGIERLNAELGENRLVVTRSEVGGRTFFAVTSAASPVELHYTYADSYLLAAPSRALVERMLRVQSGGASLTQSAKFRELLPNDGFADFSALFYQDLGASLGSVAERLAGGIDMTEEQRTVLAEAREMARPSLAYAYGQSDSLLFAGSFGGSFGAASMLGAGGLLGHSGGLEQMVNELSEAAGQLEASTEAQ